VGCVEGEVTYTVNPDGATKVRLDVVTGMPLIPFGQDVAKKPGEQTIDDLRRQAVRSMLETTGVAAWKDVSAEFLPNGKLKFAGTAYIKRLDDFDTRGGFPLLSPRFTAERGADGSLKLVAKQDGKDDHISSKRKPKSLEEIKKMTDAELDQYILLDLIGLQSSK